MFKSSPCCNKSACTCCDPRFTLQGIFKVAAGESSVGSLRRPGGLILPYGNDRDAAGFADLAINVFRTKEFFIIGHEDCGAAKVLRNVLLENRKPQGDLEKSLIRGAASCRKEIKRRGGDVSPSEVAMRMAVWSANNFSQYPLIKSGIERGELTVTSAMLDIGSGIIREIDYHDGQVFIGHELELTA